ncbi:MAG: hypothetical protein Fur0022_02080 [Anaerolineales bacterium]
MNPPFPPPYEDRSLREKALLVAAARRQGVILIEAAAPENGGLPLPVIHDVPQLERGRPPHDYTCPWGTFRFDQAARLYAFTPANGQLPPEWEGYDLNTPLQPVIACVDTARHTATLHAGRQEITLLEVPAQDDGYCLLCQINALLAKNHQPCVAWRVEWTGDESNQLWPQNVPMVRNDQVSAYLTGYALDREHLIYVGMAGYKTVLESIRATVQSRKKKLLEVHAHFVTPLPDQYVQIWQFLDDFGYHHAALLARPALPGKWEPDDLDAYLLCFEEEDVDAPSRLAARLAEGLCLPILPAWGQALWDAGWEKELVREITVGGDCLAGYAVALTEDAWTEIVQQLLEEKTITIH